ncbi:hypothetical protein ACIQTT_04430 [Microbacterium sp. NPDC090225]|uniref:hypothetical protein n=1 Tax=Microbacterium sp. NPDC090225 TaxID=3364207 RepID=UPI0037FBBE82
MKRGTGRLIALWVVFIAVHALTAWLGWVYPSQPMGDVVLVYEPWATAAVSGGPIVGITETWVYPQLALAPMLLVKAMAVPFVGFLGVSGAYLVAWALFVTALDALAFAVLLGRSPSAPRRTAAWFWSAALLLLGPIALYRLDAVTLPIVVVAGLWLVSRPALAAALLTIGAWIKIWPGAVLLAALIAGRHRLRLIVTALAVTAAVVAGLLLLGAREHLFGFLTQQGGRGLQIEAVAATPFLWAVPGGSARIEYSFDILTFQIAAPGADIVAVALTGAMVVVVAGILVLSGWKAIRGAAFARLLPPLALSLVAALIVTNKVGSPQFQVWLIAPVILWLVLDRVRAVLPAAVVLVLCALTCLVYPIGYDGLLHGQILPIVVLSARNLLLAVLLVIGIRAVVRTPANGSDRSQSL